MPNPSAHDMLRVAVAQLMGLGKASPEVDMAVRLFNNVINTPEFFLAVRRQHGGFDVEWHGLGEGGTKAKWKQMSMF